MNDLYHIFFLLWKYISLIRYLILRISFYIFFLNSIILTNLCFVIMIIILNPFLCFIFLYEVILFLIEYGYIFISVLIIWNVLQWVLVFKWNTIRHLFLIVLFVRKIWLRFSLILIIFSIIKTHNILLRTYISILLFNKSLFLFIIIKTIAVFLFVWIFLMCILLDNLIWLIFLFLIV